VELHGGLVGVKSEGVGRGSSFYFELPLYLKQEETAEVVANNSTVLIDGLTQLALNPPNKNQSIHINEHLPHLHSPRIFPEQIVGQTEKLPLDLSPTFDIESVEKANRVTTYIALQGKVVVHHKEDSESCHKSNHSVTAFLNQRVVVRDALHNSSTNYYNTDNNFNSLSRYFPIFRLLANFSTLFYFLMFVP